MTVGPYAPRSVEYEQVGMKPLVAALASASLLAAPFLAAPTSALAQHHGSRGSWGGGASGSMSAGSGASHGGWTHGSGGSWSGGTWAGHHMDGGFHHFHHDRFPVFFGGFGLGLALGAAWDPWWWDGPYYGWAPYPAYAVGGPPPAAYGGDAPPPGAPAPQAAAPPAAACGSWSWDAAKGQYNWIPCPPPPTT
jgi:hypothetical protein